MYDSMIPLFGVCGVCGCPSPSLCKDETVVRFGVLVTWNYMANFRVSEGDSSELGEF